MSQILIMLLNDWLVCPTQLVNMSVSGPAFHRLDMTLAVAEALNPNKPKLVQPVQANDCVHLILFCVHRLVD